jgi:hypothetical protein
MTSTDENAHKRKRSMEDLNSITDFRSLARVREIDKQVYDLALECNLNKDQLARLLFETYSDQVLECLDMLVSSCNKPDNTAATNETDENASTQESMKKKKQEILNFYGFVEDSELKQLVSRAKEKKMALKMTLPRRSTVLSFTKRALTTWMIQISKPGVLPTLIQASFSIMCTYSYIMILDLSKRTKFCVHAYTTMLSSIFSLWK